MTDAEKLALIKEYLSNSLTSFEIDPATSPYQEGYKSALIQVQTYVLDL